MSQSTSAELERRKLDAIKELAYGASHEINNPLANIAARAQTLLRDETHPERRRALEAIHQQALRAHEMISDLMLFARPPELVREQIDLCHLVRDRIAAVSAECGKHSIDLQANIPNQPISGCVDSQQLSVAISSLITNAAEAIGENGCISVTLRDAPATDSVAASAMIEVSDDGPGISEEVRQHLFDPFYSGREAGRGLGFGLSKCWRIVTDHGGEILVTNNKPHGACLTIVLPLVADG